MKLPSGYYHKGGMTVESTKERILETALTLFARNGYLGTSMSDIAGALGITKAALYKHYAGKQEILDRIVERMCEMDYARAAAYEMPETEPTAACGSRTASCSSVSATRARYIINRLSKKLWRAFLTS